VTHLAPQRTRKAGAKVWQESQATTHCHRACGPDLKSDVAQDASSVWAARNAMYSPAMYAKVMKFSCTDVPHEVPLNQVT
jgi:hypothetical protein